MMQHTSYDTNNNNSASNGGNSMRRLSMIAGHIVPMRRSGGGGGLEEEQNVRTVIQGSDASSSVTSTKIGTRLSGKVAIVTGVGTS